MWSEATTGTFGHVLHKELCPLGMSGRGALSPRPSKSLSFLSPESPGKCFSLWCEKQYRPGSEPQGHASLISGQAGRQPSGGEGGGGGGTTRLLYFLGDHSSRDPLSSNVVSPAVTSPVTHVSSFLVPSSRT